MVSTANILNHNLEKIAHSVAKQLSFAKISGKSAFISTGVLYPNGTSVVVRIDEINNNYLVSDDGYAACLAETMGIKDIFFKVAGVTARRSGIEYDNHAFFLNKIPTLNLPFAVMLIANASSQSIEKTIFSADQIRIKPSRQLFEQKMIEAFGKKASFDVGILGATKEWKVDGAYIENSHVIAAYEYVSPSFNAIAAAHLKMGDITIMDSAPKTVIVLENYKATDAAMRQILSSSVNQVISADSPSDSYRIAA